MSDDALMKILYQLLTTDNTDIDGWELTSVRVEPDCLSFDLHNYWYQNAMSVLKDIHQNRHEYPNCPCTLEDQMKVLPVANI